MYLHQPRDNEIIIGPRFILNEFPRLMEQHIQDFPGTLDLENEASELINSDFDSQRLETYIRNVCRWGNFAGIAGRVINNNDINEIKNVFRDAYNLLNQNIPNASAALARVNMINGLGTPSFASKHLRFIKPEICPVYDAILTDKLPYAFDPEGYGGFTTDCQAVAEQLNNNNIQNPGRQDRQWFAADVEAVLFITFYGNNL